jgi:hypothetical protein
MAGHPGCWMGGVVQYGFDGSIRNADSCSEVAFVLVRRWFYLMALSIPKL